MVCDAGGRVGGDVGIDAGEDLCAVAVAGAGANEGTDGGIDADSAEAGIDAVDETLLSFSERASEVSWVGVEPMMSKFFRLLGS